MILTVVVALYFAVKSGSILTKRNALSRKIDGRSLALYIDGGCVNQKEEQSKKASAYLKLDGHLFGW